MRFSRLVFLIAGIYGILVLAPGYFGEAKMAARFPPAVTHPEYYYGFFGVALAWQIAFLVIAKDPARFRPIIPAAIIEKLSYAAATTTLFVFGRLATLFAIFGLVDLALGVLFAICYVQLGKSVTHAARASS